MQRVEQIIATSANVPLPFATKCAVDVVLAVLDAIIEPGDAELLRLPFAVNSPMWKQWVETIAALRRGIAND